MLNKKYLLIICYILLAVWLLFFIFNFLLVACTTGGEITKAVIIEINTTKPITIKVNCESHMMLKVLEGNITIIKLGSLNVTKFECVYNCATLTAPIIVKGYGKLEIDCIRLKTMCKPLIKIF